MSQICVAMNSAGPIRHAIGASGAHAHLVLLRNAGVVSGRQRASREFVSWYHPHRDTYYPREDAMHDAPSDDSTTRQRTLMAKTFDCDDHSAYEPPFDVGDAVCLTVRAGNGVVLGTLRLSADRSSLALDERL